MNLELAGRAYIVTGGSRGLGFATAEALAAEGANVLIVARRDAAAVADSIGAKSLTADLADAATPGRAVGAALEHFGRLDGALLSVGGPTPGSVLSLADEQWRAAFETVFLGAVRGAREIGAHLAEHGGGAIGLVLSTAAVEPVPGLSLSNGLRPGLAMLVSDLAAEIGPRGVRTFGLLPGRIATERIAELEAAAGDPAAARAAATARIPLQRYGSPEEFGRVAAFLLSPAASYVTGTLLAVDGGLLQHP